MLSKAQNKYIRSLTQQKYRKEHQVFIAEGDKIAQEWLNSNAPIQMIVALQDWADQYSVLIQRHLKASLHIVTAAELETISGLQTANQALLVVQMPEQKAPGIIKEWCLALDNIQDPGNMGTIIRIADWFGINHIIASHDSVDFYNPKVVQSAMGGHLRVQLYTADLHGFISGTELPILAATLGGEDVYKLTPPGAGVLIIGNESKGIDAALIAKATHKITIPKKGGAESLNAAVSTGILCALLLGR